MFPNATLVRVGNKKLSVSGCADSFEQMMHTLGVEFFKNIVQQNNGSEALGDFQHIILRQFHRKEQAFTLALGSNIFKLKALQPDINIVTMNTGMSAL